jgi:hypothetical protein
MVILKRILLMGGLIFPALAFGQRGTISTAQAPETPLSGFPGVFDTFTAPKGAIVGQATTLLLPVFPLIGIPVDYGVTENFTLGTNALFPVLWSTGSKAFGAKARYRIVPHERFSLAITGYGYWFGGGSGTESSKVKESAGSGNLFATFATLNASFFLSERTWFNAHLSRLSMTSLKGEPKDSTYQKSDSALVLLGLGAEHFFSSWFGLRALAVAPLYLASEADSGLANENPAAGTTTIGISDATKVGTLNLTADFRFGARWMLSIGTVASEQKELTGFTIDVARRFM